MERLFYRLNPWWEGDVKFPFIERKRYLSYLRRYLNTKDIVFLTGLRRVGKTTLMRLFIAELIEKHNINPSDIFYISLDYYGLERHSILEIVEEYRKIHRIPFDRKVFLFLDEVAYKKDFDLQLKNIYDTSTAKVYASSSSSSLLRDRKALLTGREKIIEVLPLDFNEFIKFKNIRIKKADWHLLESYFEDYMKTGGIPEYVLTEDVDYIKQLIDDILYKDIIAYHNIKEKETIREFFYLLMERAGKQVSLNRISKILNIGVDTAKRFMGYFQETYLIHTIQRCGRLNERLRSPKKIYAGDVGIKNALTGFRDKGAIFENLVFFLIKDKEPCYIYRDKIEIDFLTKDRTLIEIKFNSEMNKKQEKLFEQIKAKEKIIVDSVEKFFLLLPIS